MSLACGVVPDHRTMAALIASLNEELSAIVRDMLRVGGAQEF
jgi:hypothetical protein